MFSDLYGPLPVGKYGYQYIYVIQDVYSKVIRLYPMRKATGRGVLACTKRFHGEIPIETIITDNGPQFTSKVWENGLSELGIRVTHTSVYCPNSNSVERVNRELGRLIRSYCGSCNKSWVDILPEIETCYNNVNHTSTGFAPNELAFGRREPLVIDKELGQEWLLKHVKRDSEQLRREAIENTKMASERRKRQADKRRRIEVYRIGDYVKIKTFVRSNKEHKIMRKFSLLYKGPYIVSAVVYPNCYTLVDPITNKVLGNYNTINIARYYVRTNKT